MTGRPTPAWPSEEPEFDRATRGGAPPRLATEANPATRRIAELEGAESALLLAGSCLAAMCSLMALTNPGGHVIVSAYLTGATRDFLRGDFTRMGRRVSFADCTDADAVTAQILPQTQLIFAESLVDPVMSLAPIDKLATIAHTFGLILAVDNSALSPALLRPLDLGAAVVIEDCAAYLDDHGEIQASVVCGSRRHLSAVRGQAAQMASTPDIWTSSLLERSLRTLALRMRAHDANAEQVATYLRGHPHVIRVRRPSFAELPWAMETHQGFGGLLSFEPRGGLFPGFTGPDSATADEREPLDGMAALGVSRSARSSHASLGARERSALHIGPRLVRVKAGIDDPAPLIRGLSRFLDVAWERENGGPCAAM